MSTTSKVIGTKVQGTEAIGPTCPCRVSSHHRGEKGKSGAMPNPQAYVFWCPHIGELTHSEESGRFASDLSYFTLPNKQIVLRGSEGTHINRKLVIHSSLTIKLTISVRLYAVPLTPPFSLSQFSYHLHYIIISTNTIINTSHFEKAESTYASSQYLYSLKAYEIVIISFCVRHSRANPQLISFTISAPIICYGFRFRLRACVAQSHYIYLQIYLQLYIKNQTKRL
jgi:hypothetical protein